MGDSMGNSVLRATGTSQIPERFGTAVSLNNAGTVLAVGAPQDGVVEEADPGAYEIYQNGKVVIFRLQSIDTWSQNATFQGSPLTPFVSFSVPALRRPSGWQSQSFRFVTNRCSRWQPSNT